ncbi:MAG: LamG domain-containing protein [Candidatus Omnitrophica bacterium]|nr:LamG domain-containing protein [Candidatus Omnitrophota bacterium]
MRKIILAMFLFLGCVLVSTANAELVGYWNLDEGNGNIVHDYSGYGNNGTIFDTYQWVDNSPNGYAIDFKNYGGLELPDTASLHFNNTFTLMAWVKPNDFGPTWSNVIGTSYLETKRRFYLTVHATTHKVYMDFWNSNNEWFELQGNSPLALTAWTHVAVTYNGSSIELYINGVPDGSTLATGNVRDVIGPIYISKQADVNDWPFPGDIDDVRIYNNARTREEIIADMNHIGPPPVGELPIADAGRDIVAAANTTVTLDGRRSYDPDGNIVYYSWKRMPDSVIVCSSSTIPTCSTKSLGRAEEVIELKVYDNNGNTATDTMTIINRRVHRYLLSVIPIDDQNVRCGNPVSFQASVEDPGRFGQLEFSLEESPNGSNINAITGEFNWTPECSQTGVHYVAVGVTDGYQFDERTVKVTVTYTPKPPEQPLPMQMAPGGDGI